MYTSLIMNSEAIMHEFVSRPKVNRLPLPPTHSYSNILDADVIKWSLWLLGSLALFFIVYQYSSGLIMRKAPIADDARLMEVVDSYADIAKPSDSTLYFRDSNGYIMGSMVSITTESAKITPSRVYNNDTSTESELLSILSKY